MNRLDFFKCLFGKGLELFEPLGEGEERPPGALRDEAEFKSRCTGCDACMKACPVNVIMVDDLVKRYPVIYPKTAPCVHCEGYPCIAACPTGALRGL